MGVWVSVCVCIQGRIRCAICYGTGERQESTSLKSFRMAEGSLEPRVVGEDDAGIPVIAELFWHIMILFLMSLLPSNTDSYLALLIDVYV